MISELYQSVFYYDNKIPDTGHLRRKEVYLAHGFGGWRSNWHSTGSVAKPPFDCITSYGMYSNALNVWEQTLTTQARKQSKDRRCSLFIL
jgi:hypothetical protein